MNVTSGRFIPCKRSNSSLTALFNGVNKYCANAFMHVALMLELYMTNLKLVQSLLIPVYVVMSTGGSGIDV